MSDSVPPPPPPYQVPYHTPHSYSLPPNPRPTSVTVLAILAIVFGGLGTLCGWVGLMPYLGGVGSTKVSQAVHDNHVLFAWVVFALLWAWVMNIVLLTGGIKSLGLKPAGRMLLLFFAWASLAMIIPSTAMNLAYMAPTMQKLKATYPGDPTVAAGALAGQIGAIAGVLIALAADCYVIFVMTRPHVKAAFAGGAIPPPGPQQVIA